MALPAVDNEARLIALLDKTEIEIRDGLIAAILSAKGSSTLDELARLIEQGMFEEALTFAAGAGAVSVADGYAAVFTLAGRDTAEFLQDVLDVVVGFNQVNQRAVNVMQGERLRLINGFTAEQRNATRTAIVDGMTRGLNPIEQARNFRSSIGLTGFQQNAVINYRQLLEQGSTDALRRELRDRRFDGTVRRASSTGRPIPVGTIDRMVERYGERYLVFRTNTIARTEALRAVHQGTDESFRQAIDLGLIDGASLVRTWVTARDERVRSSHRRLNGETRGIDEDFKQGLRFPGDPRAPARETVQCRCALSTRIDEPLT